MKYILSILILLINLSLPSFANNIKIISQRDWLSSNSITDLKFDSKHFLWLATENGLNRYDGIHNYVYKQNIISGKISAIELIDSLLLVSNKKKLFIINTNNSKLDSIYLPKKHNTIIKLFKLKNNRLVAYSSSGGLLFFDEKFKIVSVIQLNASEKVGIEQYNQFLFLTQPFINNRGIVRIDLNSLFNNKIKLHDKVKYYKAEFTYTQNQIINNDKLGLLFVSRNGICYYNSKLDDFIKLPKLGEEITNLFNNNESSIYIIKNNFSAIEYNIKTNKIVKNIFDNKDNFEITKIYRDEDNLFLCSNDGLVIINQIDLKIKPLQPSIGTSTENALIVRRSIVESDEYIYFFNYRSIYKLKENSTEYEITNLDKLITYSAENISDNIYLGTEGNGLLKYNIKSNKVSTLLAYDKFPKNSFISYIKKVSNNLLLVATNKGLFKYNISSNTINQIDYSNNKNQYSVIKHILFTKNQEYWISTSNGLFILNKDLKYTGCINKNTTKDKLCSDSINYVYQLSDSIYWLGTNNGIQKYNTTLKKLSNPINTKDGLSNNIITSIHKDKHDRLWVSTFNGLNVIESDGASIIQLYKTNGLKNNEYNFNSSLLHSNGKLYLGGINGYDIIDINEIQFKKKQSHEIQISEIINVNTLNREQLSSLYDGTSLKYNANNNLMRIKFTTTDYFNSDEYNYYVKLDGLSNAWIDVGNIPNARLFNIPRGDYRLVFKAIDKNNTSNIYQKTINFHVSQVFYKQIWFIPGITLLTLLLIVLIFYTNRKIIQTRFKLNQKLIIEQELHEALNKQKELSNMRSRFVALISHEYRTPLTAIQSSVDLLQLTMNRNIEDKLERQTSYLNNIKNQIQRLVEIINGVVTLNKSGDKFNDAVIMPVEMSTFIKEIIKDFKIYDTQCIVNFIKVHDKDIVCKIDKETFKNAFNNILSNAIKYYYRDTEIDVTISIDKNNNCKIIVRNLGIGIIQDELDKVFDIFFRGSNVGNTPGLGTGLPMAKEFIRFNNGDIKIESYVNEYVNVIITLPLYKEELVEIV